MGVALGYSVLAHDSLQRGMDKLEVNEAALAADLDAAWEVLAEPVQTVMRALAAQGYPDMENPYERLKEHTRGRRQGRQELAEFIDGLGVPDDVRNTLLALTPASYVGLASTLVADHLD